MRAIFLVGLILFLLPSSALASKIICMEFHICPKQLYVESRSSLSPFDEAYGAVEKYTMYTIKNNPTIKLVPKQSLMKIYISTLQHGTEWRDYFLYTLKDRKKRKIYRSLSYGEIIVESVYDANSNTIYFPDTWDHRNVRDRGLLAHELTHVAQQQSFVSPECQAGLEEIALLVGFAFLLENNYFGRAAARYPGTKQHVMMQEYKNQIGWISVCIDFKPAAQHLF